MTRELATEVSRERVRNNIVSKCKVSSDEYDIHSSKGVGRLQESAPDEGAGRQTEGAMMCRVACHKTSETTMCCGSVTKRNTSGTVATTLASILCSYSELLYGSKRG